MKYLSQGTTSNFKLTCLFFFRGRRNYKESEIRSKKILKGRVKNADEGAEELAIWVEGLLCKSEYVSLDPTYNVEHGDSCL